MKTYISVNIVSRALILMSAMKKFDCDSIQKIAQLRLSCEINKDAALAFLQQCGWVMVNRDIVSLTLQGESIVGGFNGQMIDCSLWRNILSEYIEKCQPVWARRIPYGRKEAYLIMNPEEQRCFDEAGLMDSTDSDVIKWWDSQAEIERGKKDASHLNTGREGERLTMMFEQQRTGKSPIWKSIETNMCGYDIMSYCANALDEMIMIEVKSSCNTFENAFFIVTRNEWKIAQLNNNIDRYFFYLWHLRKDKSSLAIVDSSRMSSHIPIDSNSGRWKEVSIPYSAFEDLFVSGVINE